MKNSTRNMLGAAAITPVAVLFAGAPAHAATDGPTASLLKGITAQTSVASTADPVVKVGIDLVDGLVIAGQGEARVQVAPDGAQKAVAQLSRATAKPLGFYAIGLTAKCTTTVDGQVRGLTRLTSGQALGLDLPLVPAVDTRLQLADGAFVILNRQVIGAKGALTVTAASLTSKTGSVTDLGLAHCSAERVIPGQRTAVSAVTKNPDLLGGVKSGGAVTSLLGGTSPIGSVTGGLGGVNAPLVKPPTGDITSLASRKAHVFSSADATTSVPGALPMSPDNTLSSLLGGLPGLPGMMPAGVMSVLPANPLG